MPAFSLRALLGIVFVCAVAFVSLLNPVDWVQSCWNFVILLVLLGSVLGAIYERGVRRSAWLGFALFGWAHALTLGNHLGMTGSLVTPFARPAAYFVVDNLYRGDRLAPYRMENPFSGRQTSGRGEFVGRFTQVAETIGTLPFGLLGAWLAVRFSRASSLRQGPS